MKTSATSIESFSQLNADKRDAQTRARSGHAFKLVRIYTDKVTPNPHNPRQINVDALEQDAEFLDLVTSVQTHGVLQPILVRGLPPGEDGESRYELVAGERRWRAAMAAGLESVPAVISTFDDSQAQVAALVENLQRQDIRPLDEARGLRTVMETFGLSESKLGDLIGKNRSYVNNRLRLLNCDPALISELEHPESPVSAQHALLLQGIDADVRPAFLEVIKATGAGYNKMLERKKLWDDIAAGQPDTGPATARQQLATWAAQGLSRSDIDAKLNGKPVARQGAEATPSGAKAAGTMATTFAINDLQTIRLVSGTIAAEIADPRVAIPQLLQALEADLKAVRKALQGG
jgi:ParB family chromosome partitioning protein